MKQTPTAKQAPPVKSIYANVPLTDAPPKSGSNPFGISTPSSIGPLAVPPGPKLTAEEWEKKGRDALAARKFEDAIGAFTQAIHLKSSLSPAFYGLGLAYEAQKQYADAARAFQTLASLNPNSAQAYTFLASALAQANQTDAALRALNRAIELVPESADLYMQQGGLYMQQREYKSAAQAYVQALGADPENVRAHIGLGEAYEQDGRHLTALDEYDAALRLDPGNVNARLSRATTLGSLKRLKEAEELLMTTSSELEITDTQMRARLATTADPRQQAQLQALIAQLPTQQALVHVTRAQILDTVQRREEAIREYQAAIKITPDNATTWGNLGWTQYEAGQYEAAIQSSRKALELDGSLAYVRLNLGLLYAVQNKWMEAQQEYRAALHVSTPADLNAGISDIRDALVKQPASHVLQQALTLLSQAANK